MSYFATNAQEEALKEIAKQMRITNSINLLHELRVRNEIPSDEYIEKLKQLLKST